MKLLKVFFVLFLILGGNAVAETVTFGGFMESNSIWAYSLGILNPGGIDIILDTAAKEDLFTDLDGDGVAGNDLADLLMFVVAENGAIVGANNDAFAGEGGEDGSVSTSDPYLSLFLPQGDYSVFLGNTYVDLLDFFLTGEDNASKEGVLTGDFMFSIGAENLVVGSDFVVSDENQTDPVPEPATMILLGTGIAAWFGWQRKNRKSKISV